MTMVGNGPSPVAGTVTSTSRGTPSKLGTSALGPPGQKRTPSCAVQVRPKGAGVAADAAAGTASASTAASGTSFLIDVSLLGSGRGEPTPSLGSVRRRLLLALPLTCLALLAIVVALVGLTGGARAPSHPPALAGGERPTGIPVHPFALRDERGRTVRLADFRGHPVALLFVRTDSPTASPLAADSVRSALDHVPAARAVAISTAPGADTAAARRRFLTRERLAGDMPYLSGPPAA